MEVPNSQELRSPVEESRTSLEDFFVDRERNISPILRDGHASAAADSLNLPVSVSNVMSMTQSENQPRERRHYS